MAYTITTHIAPDGSKTYGFVLPDGYRQLPCWELRRDAVESAVFHIRLREAA